jgi:hypothetical protein
VRALARRPSPFAFSAISRWSASGSLAALAAIETDSLP